MKFKKLIFCVLLFFLIFLSTSTAFSQYDGAYYDGAYDGGYDATYDAPYPQGNCTTYTSTNVPITIPDTSTVTSYINVPSAQNLLTVEVKNLNILHSYDPDLDVYLISPSGTSVELFTDVGTSTWYGGSTSNFSNTRLSQSASNLIANGSAPFNGTYRPEGDLGSFIGQNGSGTWNLRITDDTYSWFAGNGTLNSWSLDLCTPFVTPIPSPAPSASGAEVYRYTGVSSWAKITAPTAGVIIPGGTGGINSIQSMVEFNGNLIAGTFKPGQAEVYSYNGTSWTKISQPTPGQLTAGGTTGIDGFTAFTVYNNQLYVGTLNLTTSKAEVYRYNGGTSWTKVSASTPGTIMSGGTTNIDSIYSMTVYNNQLYVGTRRARVTGGIQAFGQGAEIYVYDSSLSSWSKASSPTPGVIDPLDSNKRFTQVDSMSSYNGALYAAAAASGGLVVYRFNGSVWTTVSQPNAGQLAAGGTTGLTNAFSMLVHNNELYIGANGSTISGWSHNAEVYRYNGGTSWTRISQSTPGQIAAGGTTGIDLIPAMVTNNLSLYIGVEKFLGGAEIYRYNGNTSWTRVSSSPGTITSGGTSGIDGVWSLANYGSTMYSGTEVASATSPSPTPTGSGACFVTGGASGGIISDNAFNNCSSGTANYSGPATLTLNNSSGTQTGSVTIPSVVNGTYTVADSSCSGQRFLTLSGIGNSYSVRSVSIDNGPFLSTNLSGPYTTQGFTYSGPNTSHTIKWCLSQGGSWFQTDRGDVRMPSLVNLIPSNNSASTNPTFPGIFISSSSDPNFGGFTPSAKNWQVGREYSYNNDFVNGLGGTSYDFYKSQAKKKNIAITSINPGSVNISSLSSGIYEVNGNATIPAGSVSGGKHVILLVNGSATITGNISVPSGAGTLFVLAAKNNITVSTTVGGLESSITTNLEGIYTAQGSIFIPSGANCSSGIKDLRLNVGGALTANSLHPFAIGQTGVVNNARTLCGSNTLYPSYAVYSRPDFVLQLTDFYKTTYKSFREVEP